MKQLFQENKNAFLLLLGLLFVLLFAIYFFLYRPAAVELKQSENETETLSDEIAILEARISSISEDEQSGEPDEEELALAAQLPSSPEIDTLLLKFDHIENLTDSRIEAISFSYQGSLPERQENVAEEQEDTDSTEEGNNEAETIISTENLPEGLQPIIATLHVQAPDYNRFQLILNEIENEERMMIVPNLVFNQPDESELIFSEDPNEAIDVTIDIMMFYLED